MDHPLLGSLRDVDLNELIEKISSLSQKYNQAVRFGNEHLARQVRMVLNNYQGEYQRRMVEAAEKAKTDTMLKDKVKVKK